MLELVLLSDKERGHSKANKPKKETKKKKPKKGKCKNADVTARLDQNQSVRYYSGQAAQKINYYMDPSRVVKCK